MLERPEQCWESPNIVGEVPGPIFGFAVALEQPWAVSPAAIHPGEVPGDSPSPPRLS